MTSIFDGNKLKDFLIQLGDEGEAFQHIHPGGKEYPHRDVRNPDVFVSEKGKDLLDTISYTYRVTFECDSELPGYHQLNSCSLMSDLNGKQVWFIQISPHVQNIPDLQNFRPPSSDAPEVVPPGHTHLVEKPLTEEGKPESRIGPADGGRGRGGDGDSRDDNRRILIDPTSLSGGDKAS